MGIQIETPKAEIGSDKPHPPKVGNPKDQMCGAAFSHPAVGICYCKVPSHVPTSLAYLMTSLLPIQPIDPEWLILRIRIVGRDPKFTVRHVSTAKAVFQLALVDPTTVGGVNIVPLDTLNWRLVTIPKGREEERNVMSNYMLFFKRFCLVLGNRNVD